MDSINLLKNLTNAFGVSGFEDDVLKAAKSFVNEDKFNLSKDSVKNLYIRNKNENPNKPIVMLDAHSDEVGFMVHAIMPNGLIRFINLGGWVNNTIPAHKVCIKNSDGEYINGIVASKPPHYMSEAEKGKQLSISDMAIDVGATSYEEVVKDFKIKIGSPIVPSVNFEFNEKNGVMSGKAFDCRAGCACVLETLETLDMLSDKELAVNVVGALVSQEEVGTRGAKVTANTVKPDLAIVFEGCPADDNFADSYMIQTALKKGPMLRHIDRMMITNPAFIKYALDIAGEKNIPVQEAVREGGATNGAQIHLSENGVPVIVIGIPVRYIHTHYGYAALEDYKNSVKLAVEIIKSLNVDIVNELKNPAI